MITGEPSLRVLLVDPSSRGGIPRYTALVARALRDASASPTILTSKALDLENGDVPVVRRLPDDGWGAAERVGLVTRSERLLRWVVSAFAVMRETGMRSPDIVHFQAPINRRLDAFLVRRLRRRAVVIWTAHDVLPHESTPADRERFGSIYRATDAVLVHSSPAAAAVRELAAVDAQVMAHPVPDHVVRVDRLRARQILGLPESERLFSALGFIRAYKGYDLLADVWERLGEMAPWLLVSGEVPLAEPRPELERLRTLPRAIVRLGYMSDEELQLAVSASDAVLLPYAAGSDSGLLHLARAVGVPVIASDAPQLAAAVTAARAGIVVPRSVDEWSRAVTAPLPPAPPKPPTLRRVGEEHLAVYRRALDSRALSAVRLRVAVYTDADTIGGAEKVLATLVEGLDPALDVILVGTHPPVLEWIAERRAGAPILVVPAVSGKLHLGAIVAHWTTIRRLRPSVLHANLRHPWSCQYGLAAALLVPGVRVVAVEHLPTPPAASAQRALKNVASRRLHAHVAVGARTARELERMIGLPAGSIETIHNGVDRRPVRPPRASAGRTVAVVGRLTEQKGVDVLLRALVEIPGVDAVVVGDGPEREALGRLREALSLGDRVTFVGWLEDPGVVLDTVDALVVPSRYEALPLVVLEAMFAGLPVVASDVGSVSEAVVAGETGLLVPPDDPAALAAALRNVLDPVTGRAMGSKGQELAETSFTADRMVHEYEALYARLTRAA